MTHPTDNDTTQQSSQRRTSHVTAAPETMPGHDYDPRFRTQLANEPKVVHTSRLPNESNLSLDERNRLRHERSVKQYPHLNLSEGEFVIMNLRRHPIGLLLPAFTTGAILLFLTLLLVIYPSDGSIGIMQNLPGFNTILWPVLLLMLLVATGGFMVIWIYLQNQFYLTNESVIQEIQTSLFSRHEQTVSLGSIEDASYRQHGILQTVLNYGLIRLSTEGEETTYRFAFVSNPRAQVAVLNNAVEAFKNGRPVDPHES